MPTAPRYGGSQVERAPLPGTRHPTDMPQGTAGVVTPVDLRGLEQSLDVVHQKQMHEFNQTAVVSAEAKASALETQMLHDPKQGVLALKGKNALDANKVLDDKWKKGLSEIEASLSNDVQKRAFRRSAQVRDAGLRETVARHVGQQLDEFDQQESQSLIDNERAAAVAAAIPGAKMLDVLDRSSASNARQRAVIADFARRKGFSDERREQLLSEATSKTHLQVLDRMFDNNEAEGLKYFKEIKGELRGDDVTKAEKMAEESSMRGQSQQSADSILDKYRDRGEALSAARKIQDPKLRDLVETRVNQRFNEKQAVDREHEEGLYLEATNLVDANPGASPRTVIPTSKWAQLSLPSRNALERRADGPGNNDDKTWLSFLSMGIADRGKLSQAQFETSYWTKFDRQHRERAAELWRQSVDAITSGKLSTSEITNAVETLRQVDNTLRITGLIKGNKDRGELSSEERKLYARFEQDAQQRINDFEMSQLQGKRKATFDERQKILDEMTYAKVFTDRSWFGNPQDEKSVYNITEDEAGHSFIPFETIPSEEAEALRVRILRAGRKVTRTKIERAFAAVKLRDPMLVLSIINGEDK